MKAWRVVDRKSNRHNWNIICTVPDPLYRDALVLNQLHKLGKWEKGDGWQVGYFTVEDFQGGLVIASFPKNTVMDLSLTVGDKVDEPLSVIKAMMEKKSNYATARKELCEMGFDYSTDYPIEGS